MPITMRALLVVVVLACATISAAQRGPKDAQTLAKEGAAALNERRFDDALVSFTAAAPQAGDRARSILRRYLSRRY